MLDLQYADDAALVSHSAGGLQRSLDAVVSTYSRAGLVVNTSKTEVMQQHVVRESPLSSFKVNNTVLRNTRDFVYLGSKLTAEVDLTPEVHRRIALAAAAFGRLSGKVFYNKDLTYKTKMSVFNAVCVSVLLYGCESWALHRHHIRKLESFYTGCLQKILKVHWWDKIPHAEIRRRLNALPLEAILVQRQLRWLGHTIRMPPERIPRQVLYGELTAGRRSRGGQRKRLKDHYKASLKRFGVDPTSLEIHAPDRSRWRALCTDGAQRCAKDIDAVMAARRAKRHAAPQGGAFQCDSCRRCFVALSGLKSHQRAHQRRRDLHDAVR
mgnify:CR=1 FL=1